MGKQEVIGIEEFLTPLDPKLRGGFPNRSREKEHSVRCRMIANFSQNITSKSMKISHWIFGFHQRIMAWYRSWNQQPNWHHFDGCTNKYVARFPLAQR